MKKLLSGCALLVLVLCASQARATLTDLSNGLIFDSVNNISWTKDASLSGVNTWDGQNTFAANLTLAGFDDFRLASISELTSLYSQLSTLDGCTNCTGNQDPFTNIQSVYWSGTEFSPSDAWVFGFGNGVQGIVNLGNGVYGWAVRPGDSVGYLSQDRQCCWG